MKLKELVKDVQIEKIRGELELEIKDIAYDSRQAKTGGLFICIEGFNDDGHRYVKQAVNNGAKAVIIQKELAQYQPGVTYIKVKDSREAMAYLARTFYGNPLEKISLIGVTGTNGKTTTTYLIKAILEKAGIKTGLIGTIKNIVGTKTLPATRTTPESLDLYRMFAEMVQQGLSHVVMEVSSHALDLQRVKGMEFKLGVFTNLSQDHLDYHKSLSDYLAAKSKLFQQLSAGGYAVVNLDDPHSSKIIASSRGKIFTYGIKKKAQLRARDIQLSPQGVNFKITGKIEGEIKLKLSGSFNVYNALAAISCAYLLGIESKVIQEGLETVQGVAGRFELVDEGQDFAVVVDYAHTPDGMENVLLTAKELVKGRIISVFGCGGDRDKGKRPLMGEIGVKYSDLCILTSDNPRSEEPAAIIKEIEAGILNSPYQIPYFKVLDRREAIYKAVQLAAPGDMVIIFGKGHETYQIFKDKIVSFDDREVAREALKNSSGEGK